MIDASMADNKTNLLFCNFSALITLCRDDIMIKSLIYSFLLNFRFKYTAVKLATCRLSIMSHLIYNLF